MNCVTELGYQSFQTKQKAYLLILNKINVKMIHFSSFHYFQKLFHVSDQKIKIIFSQDLYLNIFTLISYEINYWIGSRNKLIIHIIYTICVLLAFFKVLVYHMNVSVC